MNDKNLKSAEEFLIEFLDCVPENLDKTLYDDLRDGDYSKILEAMIFYARKMCVKQRNICKDHAQYEGNIYECTIDEHSILNSPYPEEISYDES